LHPLGNAVIASALRDNTQGCW